MHDPKPAFAASIRPSRCKIVILILWICGLVLGIRSAVFAGDSVASLMLGLPLMPMSIVGLLCGMGLPFLFGTLALVFDMPWLLYMVSFWKSFSFGFCAGGMQLAFGSAGWLVRCVWMFTDLCAMPLVLLFLLRSADGDRNQDFRYLWLISVLVLGVLWLDHTVIAPFGARIG